MSRLYIKTKSDLRSGNGACASQRASAEIYYGSANDSRLAGRIEVSYPKGSLFPEITYHNGLNGVVTRYNPAGVIK